MFKVKQSKSYTTPVDLYIPVENGKFKKETFTAEFRRLKRSELEEISIGPGKQRHIDMEFAKKVLVGWSGIQDEDGEEIEYTEESLEQVSEDTVQFLPAVIEAFWASIFKVREKN